MAVLFLLWLGLCYLLIDRGGFNLKNIIVAATSGIVILVPLWKKYHT